MTIRQLHRWLSIIPAIFFMLIALTGIAMQVDMWINPPPGKPSAATISSNDLTPAPSVTAVSAVKPPEQSINWHYLLQDIHAGYILGPTGRVINVLCGVIFLILSITGTWVYIDMFRRRLKSGKWQFFWR
jgi:uncharacterized iron-regulated membrane protein